MNQEPRTKNQKPRIMIYIILLSFLCVSAYGEVVDYIVAKVGRDIILKSELESQKIQLRQMGSLPADVTDEDILNDMVESKLILQTAKDRDYQVDDFRIRQMVNNQIDSQIARFGSESDLRRELNRAGMTLSQLREFYEQMIREQRLREMIIQNEIKARVYVSDIELEEYYYDNFDELPLRPEMVEIGMIRKEIKASENTRKRINKEINQIYDKIREGQDFAQLAGDYSDCPSASQGGDLGFFGRGTMVKAFEDAAFSLKPGEVSNIIETNFGYHIIKMEAIDEEDIRVRHILKMIEPTEEDIIETVEMLSNIHKQLSEGADFAALALLHSDDETAEFGGVIGEFTEERYPELFKSNLSAIKVGEFTPVIREDNDLYIFGKLRTIPERQFELEEIREELKEYLETNKQVELYSDWIDKLIEDSYVEILLN